MFEFLTNFRESIDIFYEAGTQIDTVRQSMLNRGIVIRVDDGGTIIDDVTEKSNGEGVTYSEVWKDFTGDGSTTEFDCEVNLAKVIVTINGLTIPIDDYNKNDTIIEFNEAPDDGAEIRCWILKQD